MFLWQELNFLKLRKKVFRDISKKRTMETKCIWLLRHEHQITLYMKRCRMKMYIYRIKSCCLDISIKLSISTIRIEILISYLCQQHSLRISSSSSSVCSLCYTNSKHSNCFRKIVLCRIKSFIQKWTTTIHKLTSLFLGIKENFWQN